jgi:hypothetical protein
MSLPDLICAVAPVAERYLTLLRVHPTQTYNYTKRNFFNLPVIDVQLHGRKCAIGESWLYFAIPAGAAPSALRRDARLYVGAQTQDRMFRGDGLDGRNFHHAEMRAGNGEDTPEAFFRTGRQIAIYRVSAERIAKIVSENATLDPLRVLPAQPRSAKAHLGWWFEQYVLFSQPGHWRWNTAAADKSLPALSPGKHAAPLA